MLPATICPSWKILLFSYPSSWDPSFTQCPTLPSLGSLPSFLWILAVKAYIGIFAALYCSRIHLCASVFRGAQHGG